MSQQYNKVIKRKRLLAYLKRKKLAAKAGKKTTPSKPKPTTQPPAQPAPAAASA